MKYFRSVEIYYFTVYFIFNQLINCVFSSDDKKLMYEAIWAIDGITLPIINAPQVMTILLNTNNISNVSLTSLYSWHCYIIISISLHNMLFITLY